MSDERSRTSERRSLVPGDVYLREAVALRPLVDRWPAWSQLVPPHTAALNLVRRQIPLLEGFLASPEVHRSAAADPRFYTASIVGSLAASTESARRLLDHMRQSTELLQFGAGLVEAHDVVAGLATGQPLATLYPQLPEAVRGFVELAYDTSGRPQLHIIEPFVYRSELSVRSRQTLRVDAELPPDEPFFLNSPLLDDGASVDVPAPFDDERWDILARARRTPMARADLLDALGLDRHDQRAGTLLTSVAPPEVTAITDGTRMCFLGHAGVSLECGHSSIVLDPLILGSAMVGDCATMASLPTVVDAVCLTHAHPDHLSIQTLLELRNRVRAVIVPKNRRGTTADPSIKLMIESLGFRNVVEVDDFDRVDIGRSLAVTALPFLGEHADLNIGAKAMYLVEAGGNRVLFAADAHCDDPAVVARLAQEVPTVDQMFLGLECEGAPLDWLYGPLLFHEPTRQQNTGRRLAGCDADAAKSLADAFGADQVHVYGMGYEPSLRSVTGAARAPGVTDRREVDRLAAMLAGEGRHASVPRWRQTWTLDNR